MHKDQKGSTLLVTTLAIAAVIIIGLIGWRIYANTQTDSVPAKTKEKTISSCERNGAIIVQFNAISIDQQHAIISSEGATIQQEYSSLPGLYALRVGVGNEQSAVAAFSKHSEVKTANLNHCNTVDSNP